MIDELRHQFVSIINEMTEFIKKNFNVFSIKQKRDRENKTSLNIWKWVFAVKSMLYQIEKVIYHFTHVKM